MISLKRFLASDAENAAMNLRLPWLILEAVACHAVEADPAEREVFQNSLRNLVAKMEESKVPGEALLFVGEAIKSIETYNRGVQRSVNSQLKELQAIVALFTRSMLKLAQGSDASAGRLHHIERQIEKCSQSEDLKALKVQLEQSLHNICEEAAEQRRRSDQIGDQVRETMSRPESAAVLAEAVSDLDLCTGLPSFRCAQTAIRSAIQSHTSTFAVLFLVDRLDLINSRFGFAVGDRILMRFGQHVAQRLSQSDQFFRWRGPTFLALLDRKGPEISVRAEIARILSVRMEQEIELKGRTVLLPVAASWTLASTLDASPETITEKLDTFCAGVCGGAVANY